MASRSPYGGAAFVGGLILAALLASCGSSSKPTAHVVSLPTATNVARPHPAAVRKRPSNLGRPRTRRAKTVRTPAAATSNASKPPIAAMPIPFPPKRLKETAAYARRHYGTGTYRLTNPKVIVEHFTGTSSAQGAFNLFAPDVPDTELHELPGICSHFVVDRDGTIDQFVPLGIMCRHTVGLNYTAIGVENAGFTDRQVLSNPAQMRASLALTRWLRCRFGISLKNVIGHNESLSSPYHHELIARVRNQTHPDFKRADMDVYRRRLAALPC
jgi:N-acetylmuramoyl-L-alanine amidase